MNILVLANVPPGSIGGAEVQAFRLAHLWGASGHNVIVAGNANIPSHTGNVTITRIPTVRLTRLLRGSTYLASVLWLIWRYRNQCDVIYCRFLTEQAVSASIAKKLLNIKTPLIACPACTSTDGDARYLMRLPISAFWIKLLNKNVNVVNAMSSRIEQEIIDIGLKQLVTSRIPNGVVLPDPRSLIRATAGPLRIVCVGRLVEQKGIDILIAAANIIASYRREFFIRIVGDGPLRMSLEEQSKSLGLERRISFVGAVDTTRIPDELLWADLFVLPSRHEGFPGSLLEAIAYGLPVIATKVSGSEEIVESTFGWLVTPADKEGLANAIEKALTMGRNKLNAMGKAARAKAEENYKMSIIADQYLKLFSNVSEEHNSVPSQTHNK